MPKALILRLASLFLVVLAAVFGLATPSRATAFNYSAIIDPIPITKGLADIFSGSKPTFTLAVGDTLSGTITFTNGVSLNVLGGIYTDLSFTSNKNPSVIGVGSVDLLGFSGNGLKSGSTDEQGDGTLGIVLAEPANADYSFSGFQYSVTISAEDYTASYQPASFSIDAVSVDVVPEPDTSTMLIAGLGAFLLRRVRSIRILASC